MHNLFLEAIQNDDVDASRTFKMLPWKPQDILPEERGVLWESLHMSLWILVASSKDLQPNYPVIV